MRYFEDYHLGEKGETCGRTITESDLVQFASTTGDFAPPHMDREFMAKSEYGSRVAHGWFSTCLVVGMFSFYAPYIVGRDTPAAYLLDMESRYQKVALLGDTVRLQWTVEEKALDLNQPGFGTVRTAYQLVNQDGKTVCDGVVTTEVRLKSAAGAKAQFKPGVPFKFKQFVPDFDRIYALEDFAPQEGWCTYGRMITETDVVNLMGLTQDYNRLYVDLAYAKDTVVGERIVPWMLVATIAYGLYFRDGFDSRVKTLIAPYVGHMCEKVSFLAPAKIGDIIQCRSRHEAIRVSKSKSDRGILTCRHQAINQRGEVLLEIQSLIMLPTRAAQAASGTLKSSWVLSTIKCDEELDKS